MSGYRNWTDRAELLCLKAMLTMRDRGFPYGLASELAEPIAAETGIKLTSVKTKISDYKSLEQSRGETTTHVSDACRSFWESLKTVDAVGKKLGQ